MHSEIAARIVAFYRDRYHMPDECRKTGIRRNLSRTMTILPFTFLFGAVMTGASFILPVYNDLPAHRTVALTYYGCFALFSAVLMGWCLAVKNKQEQKKNISTILPVDSAFILFHGLSLYNIFASRNMVAGYLVWIIIILVILAFFDVHPVFFTFCETVQMTILFTFKPESLNQNMLNLAVLIIVADILSFMHWQNIIRDFKSTEIIKNANKKSDELLLNILPQKIVNDLKERGTSEPELFTDVSVLFTDIVGFTAISKILPPETLISELDDIFTHFDQIIEKNGCMRIKTMGDAYMAVCGLPDRDPDHARKMVNAGIECLEYLDKRNSSAGIQWKMRAGICTGEVVAGIIGVRKYIYDVLGDTVNTAFRMQIMSSEMRLNVSESTYECTKRFFRYEKREPAEVKGKGRMTMYFVDGRTGEQTFF